MLGRTGLKLWTRQVTWTSVRVRRDEIHFGHTRSEAMAMEGISNLEFRISNFITPILEGEGPPEPIGLNPGGQGASRADWTKSWRARGLPSRLD